METPKVDLRTTNSTGGSIVSTTEAEMEAYDQLPPSLQRLLQDAPVPISAEYTASVLSTQPLWIVELAISRFSAQTLAQWRHETETAPQYIQRGGTWSRRL